MFVILQFSMDAGVADLGSLIQGLSRASVRVSPGAGNLWGFHWAGLALTHVVVGETQFLEDTGVSACWPDVTQFFARWPFASR